MAAGGRLSGRLPRIVSVVALVATVASYLAVGLWDLDVPGLQYDEAYDAVPAAELLRGAKSSAVTSIKIGGRYFPVMLHPHIGPTSTYLTLIAFSIAGVSTRVLRVSQLLVGVATLVLLWLLACTWFDDLVAAATVVFCGTAPPFVWWSRAGINWTLPLLPIALALMLALTRWWRTRSPRALIVAAFLLGAGITTKILFIWLLPALALTAVLVLGVGGVARELRAMPAPLRRGCVLAFAIGLLPSILHNVLTLGGTFRFVAANVLRTRVYGHDNLDFVHNVPYMTRAFLDTMRGDTDGFRLPPEGGGTGAWLFVGALVVVTTVCAVGWRDVRLRLGRPRPFRPGLRARVLLVLLTVTMIPLSTVTTSSLGATYLFLLVPFAWMLVAVGVVDTASALAGWLPLHAAARRSALVIAASLAVSVGFGAANVASNVRSERFLESTGGMGAWSDAITTLATKLERDYAGRTPIAMDWGFKMSVALLTNGRVRMDERFEYQPQPPDDYDKRCAGMLANPSNVYVFYSPEATSFHGYREILEATAARLGTPLEVLETLSQRDGTPNIVILGTADVRPR